jgi:hypothetical protein
MTRILLRSQFDDYPRKSMIARAEGAVAERASSSDLVKLFTTDPRTLGRRSGQRTLTIVIRA